VLCVFNGLFCIFVCFHRHGFKFVFFVSFGDVSSNHFDFVLLVLFGLGFFFSTGAKRLAGKNITEVTYFCRVEG